MLNPGDRDVRFEIEANPEPDDPASTHFLAVVCNDTDEVLETHILGDPYGFVEAYREAEAYTLEERLGPFGLAFQREEEARAGRRPF